MSSNLPAGFLPAELFQPLVFGIWHQDRGGFAAGREWTAGRISLAAGDTKVLTIPAKKIGGEPVKTFGLVITPGGSGLLYGVRMLDEEGPRGPLVTSFPLSSARLLAEVPEAYPDVAVGSTE